MRRNAHTETVAGSLDQPSKSITPSRKSFRFETESSRHQNHAFVFLLRTKRQSAYLIATAVAALAFVLLSPNYGFAQSGAQVAITGTITDSTGAVVSGAPAAGVSGSHLTLTTLFVRCVPDT
jgi:hypothetical protein